MIKRLFAAALLAGAVTGLLVSAVQSVRLVPLLVQAERYEDGHDHAKTAAPAGAHGHVPVERTALTVLADVVIGAGFALMLAAAMVARGRPVDWRLGIAWGLAAFAVVSLAPAVGLPPDVPGTDRAALADRQVWWLLTATATAGGLWLAAFSERLWLKIAGLALIAVPHLIGAPRPDGSTGGDVPAELAIAFAANALAINALFWVVLGALTAWLLTRFRVL